MSITAHSSGAARHSLGVSVAFAGTFAPLAVQLAFVPVWFEHVHFTPAEIGLLLGVPMALRIVTTPPLLGLADRVRSRAVLFVVVAAIACFASLGYFAAPGFALAMAVSVVLSVTTALAVPLADAVALSGVRRHGLDYGAMRLWGSLGFVAVTLLGGWWVERAGEGAVPLVLSLALLATFASGFALPPGGAPRRTRPAADLHRDRQLLLAIGAAAAVSASHAAFYGFASIHWAALGFSGTAIGALWTVGVVAEVALFAAAKCLPATITPLGLLGAGAAVGIARWGLFTWEGGFAWYAVNSALHAGTFAAAHLGMQRLIAVRVDDARQGAAQGLAFAVSAPAMAAATLLSGWLYGRFGVHSFWAMATLCAVGLALAVLAARPHDQPHKAGEGGDTSEPE